MNKLWYKDKVGKHHRLFLYPLFEVVTILQYYKDLIV